MLGLTADGIEQGSRFRRASAPGIISEMHSSHGSLAFGSWSKPRGSLISPLGATGSPSSPKFGTEDDVEGGGILVGEHLPWKCWRRIWEFLKPESQFRVMSSHPDFLDGWIAFGRCFGRRLPPLRSVSVNGTLYLDSPQWPKCPAIQRKLFLSRLAPSEVANVIVGSAFLSLQEDFEELLRKHHANFRTLIFQTTATSCSSEPAILRCCDGFKSGEGPPSTNLTCLNLTTLSFSGLHACRWAHLLFRAGVKCPRLEEFAFSCPPLPVLDIASNSAAQQSFQRRMNDFVNAPRQFVANSASLRLLMVSVSPGSPANDRIAKGLFQTLYQMDSPAHFETLILSGTLSFDDQQHLQHTLLTRNSALLPIIPTWKRSNNTTAGLLSDDDSSELLLSTQDKKSSAKGGEEEEEGRQQQPVYERTFFDWARQVNEESFSRSLEALTCIEAQQRALRLNYMVDVLVEVGVANLSRTSGLLLTERTFPSLLSLSVLLNKAVKRTTVPVAASNSRLLGYIQHLLERLTAILPSKIRSQWMGNPLETFLSHKKYNSLLPEVRTAQSALIKALVSHRGSLYLAEKDLDMLSKNHFFLSVMGPQKSGEFFRAVEKSSQRALRLTRDKASRAFSKWTKLLITDGCVNLSESFAILPSVLNQKVGIHVQHAMATYGYSNYVAKALAGCSESLRALTLNLRWPYPMESDLDRLIEDRNLARNLHKLKALFPTDTDAIQPLPSSLKFRKLEYIHLQGFNPYRADHVNLLNETQFEEKAPRITTAEPHLFNADSITEELRPSAAPDESSTGLMKPVQPANEERNEQIIEEGPILLHGPRLLPGPRHLHFELDSVRCSLGHYFKESCLNADDLTEQVHKSADSVSTLLLLRRSPCLHVSVSLHPDAVAPLPDTLDDFGHVTSLETYDLMIRFLRQLKPMDLTITPGPSYRIGVDFFKMFVSTGISFGHAACATERSLRFEIGVKKPMSITLHGLIHIRPLGVTNAPWSYTRNEVATLPPLRSFNPLPDDDGGPLLGGDEGPLEVKASSKPMSVKILPGLQEKIILHGHSARLARENRKYYHQMEPLYSQIQALALSKIDSLYQNMDFRVAMNSVEFLNWINKTTTTAAVQHNRERNNNNMPSINTLVIHPDPAQNIPSMALLHSIWTKDNISVVQKGLLMEFIPLPTVADTVALLRDSLRLLSYSTLLSTNWRSDEAEQMLAASVEQIKSHLTIRHLNHFRVIAHLSTTDDNNLHTPTQSSQPADLASLSSQVDQFLETLTTQPPLTQKQKQPRQQQPPKRHFVDSLGAFDDILLRGSSSEEAETSWLVDLEEEVARRRTPGILTINIFRREMAEEFLNKEEVKVLESVSSFTLSHAPFPASGLLSD